MCKTMTDSILKNLKNSKFLEACEYGVATQSEVAAVPQGTQELGAILAIKKVVRMFPNITPDYLETILNSATGPREGLPVHVQQIDPDILRERNKFQVLMQKYINLRSKERELWAKLQKMPMQQAPPITMSVKRYRKQRDALIAKWTGATTATEVAFGDMNEQTDILRAFGTTENSASAGLYDGATRRIVILNQTRHNEDRSSIRALLSPFS